MRNLRRFMAVSTLVAVAGLGVTGCSSKRWCEEDATDRRVADSYCEAGIPGYEWEPDDDRRVKVRKSKKIRK